MCLVILRKISLTLYYKIYTVVYINKKIGMFQRNEGLKEWVRHHVRGWKCDILLKHQNNNIIILIHNLFNCYMYTKLKKHNEYTYNIHNVVSRTYNMFIKTKSVIIRLSCLTS